MNISSLNANSPKDLVQFNNQIFAANSLAEILTIFQLFFDKFSIPAHPCFVRIHSNDRRQVSFLFDPKLPETTYDVALSVFMQRQFFSKENKSRPYILLKGTDVFFSDPALNNLTPFLPENDLIVFRFKDEQNKEAFLLLQALPKTPLSPDSLELIRLLVDATSISLLNQRLKKESMQREREKDALLFLSQEIANTSDKMQLLPLLRKVFKKHGFYTDISISLINDDRKTTTGYLINWNKKRHQHSEYAHQSTAKHPLADGIFDKILASAHPVSFALSTLINKPKVPSYILFLYDRGIRDMVAIALREQGINIGLLFLFSENKREFSTNQHRLLYGMSQQIGTAVANVIAEEARQKEVRDNAFLLTLSNALTKIKDFTSLGTVLEDIVGDFFGAEHCNLVLKNTNYSQKCFKCCFYDLFKEKQREILKIHGLEGFLPGMSTMITIPLESSHPNLGFIYLISSNRLSLDAKIEPLFQGIASQISLAIFNIIAYDKIAQQLQEITKYRSKLELENLYLNEQVKSSFTNEEMIGMSAGMAHVEDLIFRVSTTDTSVLITGETGTGKELVAKAVHSSSRRSARAMIKINCAAIPSNLIETELFGHEKGSFTGALERRIGKFELAHKGTLFLDEIGELSPELQAKLLRVLQEGEIERIGGREVIKIDVRIISATNRDLEKEVTEGRFRSDLFYRLNVFPIHLPPLQERKADIPELVKHFLKKLSSKLGKKVNSVSPAVMANLSNYHWPGNIRELEHVIERSILLSKDDMVRDVFLPKTPVFPDHAIEQENKPESFAENERSYIVSVLKICKWRVKGSGGAAEILGIPATTLHSKIKKLGIAKEH